MLHDGVLGPEIDGAAQRGRAAFDQNLDVRRLVFRVARQRFVDAVRHVVGRLALAQADLVDDAQYAGKRAHGGLGVVALVLPVHRAGQRDPALLHREMDAVLGNQRVPLEGRLHGSGDLGVTDPVVWLELDVQLHRHPTHASHALGRALHGDLLGKGAQVTRERDHAVLHSDAHTGGVDGGVPFEFGLHILLQLRIGLHALPP